MSLYFDGVLIGTENDDAIAGSCDVSNQAELVIGGRGYNPTNPSVLENPFTGAVDDIRIYERALSQAEVTALYTEANPTTAISNELENKVSVFPNPAQGKFTLELTEGENAQVEMFDMQGKSVLSQKVSEKESDFEVSSFAKGLYVLRVTNDKGVFTKKMLLE